MKNSLTLAFLLAAFGLMFSMQTFAQKRIPRNIEGFTALKVSSGIDVYLSQGSAPAMEIETDDESIKHLIVEVDHKNTLMIRMDRNFNWNFFKRGAPVKIRLTFTELTHIELSGGADLFGQGMLKFDKLSINASAGSDIKMSLRAQELDATCSAGSDMVLDGFAAKFKGNASGGSDIKAKELETEISHINVSGGSDAYIRVTRQLTASASGGSDIVYTGNPEKVSQNASGGSDIKKR